MTRHAHTERLLNAWPRACRAGYSIGEFADIHGTTYWAVYLMLNRARKRDDPRALVSRPIHHRRRQSY